MLFAGEEWGVEVSIPGLRIGERPLFQETSQKGSDGIRLPTGFVAESLDNFIGGYGMAAAPNGLHDVPFRIRNFRGMFHQGDILQL